MKTSSARSYGTVSTKRVSYLLATRNRSSFLEKTLLNVRELKTPDDELILIEGEESPATLSIVEKHREIIDHYISEPDLGEAHAYNKGMLAASGKYIKWLTDDDYTFPAAMENAISVLEANQTIDAVICGGENFEIEPVSGELKFVSNSFLPNNVHLTDPHELSRVKQGVGCILRRSALPLVGLLDTSYLAADSEYLIRFLASKIQFRYLDIKLYRHTTFPHSGELRSGLIVQDTTRALIARGYWTAGLKRIDPENFAHMIGIQNDRNALAYCYVLKKLEALRTGRWAWTIKLPYLALRIIDRVCRTLRKVSFARENGNAPLAAQPVRIWDGKLR